MGQRGQSAASESELWVASWLVLFCYDINKLGWHSAIT